MNTFVMLSDCVDPSDPQGRTYREINAAKTHGIPIGALVEIGHLDYPSPMDGARLFVVAHNRDCDGTPLYALCADPEDTIVQRKGFANDKWHHGYSEDSLTVIRP
jgi:hypothetical protein